MTTKNSTVTCRFADGSAISAFTEVTLQERFIEAIDTCRLVMKPPAEQLSTYLEKTQKGEPFEILVDDKPQGAFVVQMQRYTGSTNDGRVIEVSGVSPLKIPQESTAEAKLTRQLQADGPVVDLVAAALKPYGITSVSASDDIAVIKAKTGKATGAKATNVKELKYKEAKVQDNESVLDFLKRIITRLGVMLRHGPAQGEAYLTAPHYDGKAVGTIVLPDGGTRPAGDIAWSDWEIVDSNEGQYEFCEVIGTALDAEGETKSNVPKARAASTEINSQRPPFRASHAFSYKPLFLSDTESRDKTRSRSMAVLALGIRADSAFYVRCKVHGLTSLDGTPWTVDTLVHVYCESYGLDEDMWVSERTMNVSAEQGQWTELVLVPKGYVRLGEA